MDTTTNLQLASNDEILIYQSEDGTVKVDVLFQDETVWLTQEHMALLFGKGRSTITEHISNIFSEGELQEEVVCRKFRHTTQHGAIEGLSQTKEVKYYNLDVIISVGYRVKSRQGTLFRIWATQRLRDYIIKGVALNDERFKRGNSMNYFKDLLERIREIRLSEKVFYQQIKDIYKTSIDYDPSDEITLQFFKEVQNKLLWAVSGKTAAELVYYRANATLPMMGLTSTEKTGKVLKSDVGVGKNYLNEDEMKILELIVDSWIHAVAMVLVVAAGFVFRISPMEWIAVLIVIGMVFAAEILNSSLERTADFVKAERDDRKRDIKDLGAAAVLVCAIIAAIVGVAKNHRFAVLIGLLSTV